jgi:predicted CoA-binding protein
MAETVVILGASTNPNRYSYKAQLALLENGHTPVPVNPRYDQIDGIQCYPDLKSIPGDVDTITVYVKSGTIIPMTGDIIEIQPKRVIFNPGAESKAVAARLESVGIRVQNACTLVLLNTAHFAS